MTEQQIQNQIDALRATRERLLREGKEACIKFLTDAGIISEGWEKHKMEEVKREKLKLDPRNVDHTDLLYYGEDYEGDEYEWIESEIVYTDAGRYYIEEVIVRRKSDNKCFRFEVDVWGQGEKECSFNGDEVFPETITKTIYK